jgi:acyl dehydratase
MIRSYTATFVGMVYPGDTLVTQVTHTAMHAPTGEQSNFLDWLSI